MKFYKHFTISFTLKIFLSFFCQTEKDFIFYLHICQTKLYSWSDFYVYHQKQMGLQKNEPDKQNEKS